MACAHTVDDGAVRAADEGRVPRDAIPRGDDGDEPSGDGASWGAAVAEAARASVPFRHVVEDESLNDDAPGTRASSDGAEGAGATDVRGRGARDGAAPGAAAAGATAHSHRAIARDGLNVRSGPGVEFGVLQSLPLGTPVRVLKRDGSWALIARSDGGGADGYVHASFLEDVASGGEASLATTPEPSAAARSRSGSDTGTRYPGGEWMGQTRNNSGRFKSGMPKFLVMHYTAGGPGRGSAEYLFKPHSPASSAHFVVDRDGAVYQLSGTDHVTWHAGESFWRGLSYLNRYAIGIEFANYGYLRRTQDPTKWLIGATDYRSTYKDRPDIFTDDVVVAKHKKGGPELGWEPFAPAQIRSGLELTKWILQRCPTIREIVGHDDIAPDRKSDPGPAFPMESFVELLHPESEGSDIPEDGDVSASAASLSAASRCIVNADRLNCRGGPGTDFETLSWGPLAKGAAVGLLQEVGDWSFIEYRGASPPRRGWVFGRFLTPI